MTGLWRQRSKLPPVKGKQPPTEGKLPPTEGKQPPTEGKQPPTEGKLPPAGRNLRQLLLHVLLRHFLFQIIQICGEGNLIGMRIQQPLVGGMKIFHFT